MPTYRFVNPEVTLSHPGVIEIEANTLAEAQADCISEVRRVGSVAEHNYDNDGDADLVTLGEVS